MVDVVRDEFNTDVVILGSGPGGYSAAFRAADLNKKVVLVEQYENLGGVCLNVGCIPSKALLHIASVIDEAEEFGKCGVFFEKPKIDLEKIIAWKNKVIRKLSSGLKMMSKKRGVKVVCGTGKFLSEKEVIVDNGDAGSSLLKFEDCIIASGSSPSQLPFLPKDDRIMNSTRALELEKTDIKLLIIGGGIIGLEMASVYNALGAKITIAETMDQIMPGADKDLVMPLYNKIRKKYENIMLKTNVVKVLSKEDGLWVTFKNSNSETTEEKTFDKILVSVGRKPNSLNLDLNKVKVDIDERGFIKVDNQMKTSVKNIYAIGDVVGNPMLAHKASAQGRLASEVIAGKENYFNPKCIPSVSYTNPEIAWVGLTELRAREIGFEYKVGAFPWSASGRAISLDRTEGLTKILFDKNGTVVGGGIVGVNAGDLISEISLAIEMKCDSEDISSTIHPHPTTSESIMMSAEVYEGTVTDLYLPKNK